MTPVKPKRDAAERREAVTMRFEWCVKLNGKRVIVDPATQRAVNRAFSRALPHDKAIQSTCKALSSPSPKKRKA